MSNHPYKDRLRIELESIILNFIKKIRGKNRNWTG